MKETLARKTEGIRWNEEMGEPKKKKSLMKTCNSKQKMETRKKKKEAYTFFFDVKVAFKDRVSLIGHCLFFFFYMCVCLDAGDTKKNNNKESWKQGEVRKKEMEPRWKSFGGGGKKNEERKKKEIKWSAQKNS